MAFDNQATYYDAGGIETINIIKAKLTSEQFEGWLLGNCIKYSCRANFKGTKQKDFHKSQMYAKKLIELEAELLKNEKEQIEIDLGYRDK